MADEKSLRIQKAYEESLRVSQSLLGGLGKLIDDNAGKLVKGNKALNEQSKAVKSIIGGIESQEDLLEGVVKLQDKRANVDKNYFGINKKLREGKKKELDIAVQMLLAENDKLNAIKGVDAQAQQLAESLNSSLDGLMSGIGDIPLVGGLLSNIASGPVERLKAGVGDAAKMFTTGYADAVRGGASHTEALSSATSKMGGALKGIFNPALLGAVALLAVLALAFKGFASLDNAAKSFRNETGLLNSQTEGLASNIAEVTMQTAALGASAEDVAQAAASFTNTFEGVVQPSKETLKNVVALEKNFGVAADGAAKVNLMFQSIGGLSEQAAQALVSQTAQAAALVGVAPDKVIKDLAENAETAAMFFQGSVGDLSKAAIEAARLGTSLTQAAKVAEGLLDFENSITAELEASAMLGQSINFNKARELAAQGDILGAQQATLNELDKKVNLEELNFFQLQSIAKASGMEVSELQNQLSLRKQFGPLNDQQKAALDALAAKGNEIKDITKEQLDAETQSVIKQQEMQSRLDSISNRFSAIGTNLMTAFAPLMEAIIPALEFMGTVLGGIATFIGHMAKGLRENTALAVAFGLAVTALVAPMIMSAIGGIFAAFSMIPFGVGIPLAIAAVAGMVSMLSSATAVGDMFSPANGKTQVSTKEGGLFELSSNDDLAAAPNLLGGAGGGGGAAVVSAIEKLGADIRALQVVVNMDGRKVTEGVSKVVSRNQSNNYGVTV